MTDRPMKMSEEQFESLRVAVTETAERCARMTVNKGAYENLYWDDAKRLLVEPERPNRADDEFIFCTQCRLHGVARLMRSECGRIACSLSPEPEQATTAKLSNYGRTVGGPLDGGTMSGKQSPFALPGGRYTFFERVAEWRWSPTVDDPDLTTFGELGGRGWFELTCDGWPEGDRIRLLTEDRVVYDIDGIKRSVQPEEPVRRLPKPEFKP